MYSVKLGLSRIYKWFTANRLVHSLHKTNVIKFIMNYSAHCILNIGYVEEVVNMKFLGLRIYNH